MIYHFLRGTSAKDKTVRFRCCQFIVDIINILTNIHDDLYEDLTNNIGKRIYDKEASVRTLAALILTRLQDNVDEESSGPYPVTELLIKSMQHDSSAEVRRAILLNLNPAKPIISYLLERALDTNSINRRYVYSRVMKSIGDFRLLSIGKREMLLQCGLKDREASVRQAASRMFLEQWLENANNDILEVLERIDVINSTVAETAMDVFFSNRKDAIETLEFSDELWQQLTPESAFLIRTYNDFCIKEKLTAKLEDKMPELTKLGFFIEHYFTLLEQEHENIDSQFIMEQLLLIAETYDYADEVGRRKVLAILREALTNHQLTDSLIQKSVGIIRKLSVKESDFSQVIVELISDVKDKLEESLEQVSDEEESMILEVMCFVRCLVLAQSTLELIILPLESNQYLTSLLDTLVIPSIRSRNANIREGGLKCLGLCCLISKKLAAENLLLFGQCFAQGDEQMKELMLKIFTDILMIHGKEILEREENEVEINDIYKLYYTAFRNEGEPEVQKLGVISLCKLLLNGIFDEPDLIKALVLEYFNTETGYNNSLRQTLSYCIPVFCYSSPDRQRIMASVAIDSLKRLSDTYETIEDEEMLSPTQILQQLIDWTDPSRVVVAVNGELKNDSGYSDLQCDLGSDILDRIEVTYSKDERKALCLGLSRLHITPKVAIEKLERLRDHTEHVIQTGTVTEGSLKNALARFDKEIVSIIKKAEQLQDREKESQQNISDVRDEREGISTGDSYLEEQGDNQTQDTSQQILEQGSKIVENDSESEETEDGN